MTRSTFIINNGSGLAVRTAMNAAFALIDTGFTPKLSADTTFYVATTGSDVTGTGEVGTPWQTIQHAFDYILENIDLNGYTATVKLANGTYTAGVTVDGLYKGQGFVKLEGDTTTPSNVVISTSGRCIQIMNSAVLVAGVKLISSTSNCVEAARKGLVKITGSVEFGASGSAHIVSSGGGQMYVESAYTISGGGLYHYLCYGASILACIGRSVTLTGTPAFTGRFFYSNAVSSSLMWSNTYTGSATGQRYYVETNSVVSTGGGGASYFPGSTAGATATGGQYI